MLKLSKLGVKFPYSKMRVRALRALGYEVGKDVYFPADITITQHFVWNKVNLKIGDRVSIGPKVVLAMTSHANFSKINSQIPQKPYRIEIKNDAWIGAGAIILPGVTIGEGCIVGAGAVVTKDTPNYSVVVGNPAHVLRIMNEKVDGE